MQTGFLGQFDHQARSHDDLEAVPAQQLELLPGVVRRLVGVLLDLDVEQILHRIQFGDGLAVRHHADTA